MLKKTSKPIHRLIENNNDVSLNSSLHNISIFSKSLHLAVDLQDPTPTVYVFEIN